MTALHTLTDVVCNCAEHRRMLSVDGRCWDRALANQIAVAYRRNGPGTDIDGVTSILLPDGGDSSFVGPDAEVIKRIRTECRDHRDVSCIPAPGD